MKETWLPIKGYEHLYEVASTGRVRSVDRMVLNTRTGRCYPKGGAYMHPTKAANGYMVVNLKGRTKYVHRLVVEAFVGSIPPKMDINHKNGNRTDNNLQNLEICTRRENILHSFRVLGRKGNHAPTFMKAVLQMQDGIIVGRYPSAREAERKTGVSHKRISRSCHSKYRAGGYKWELEAIHGPKSAQNEEKTSENRL